MAATIVSTHERATAAECILRAAVVLFRERGYHGRSMRTLARRQREVLACRYVLELSIEETAQMLDLSKGAVKAHTHRGLQALQE